jgi:hypothetical protein
MDKVYLRSLFVQEKDFLKKLYDGQGNALTFASDKSLNTLIKILHLIAEGHIPMRKQDEAEIKTAKKFNSLNKFASKTFFFSRAYTTPFLFIKNIFYVFSSLFRFSC